MRLIRGVLLAAVIAVTMPLCAVAQPAGTSRTDAAAQLTALQTAMDDAFAKRDWDKAAEALAAMLAIHEKASGPDSAITLTTLDSLAISLQLGGRAAEAERLFRRELEARRRIEGAGSPNIARLLTSMAFNLTQQNRLADAEASYRQVVEQTTRISGADGVETAQALILHAGSLARLGRSGDALRLAERARDTLVRNKGAESIEAAQGHDSVGKLLANLGRYSESEQQHRRALAIRIKLVGDKATETSASRNNLAIALTQQGKFAEAATLLRQALAARRATEGEHSPLLADVLVNLATVLQNGGDPAAAEPLHREALAILTASAPESPARLTALTNLATCLHELGRYDEAEPLAREALAGRFKIHGENHPETAIAAGNLAADLSSLGRDVEAEQLYRRALAIMQATNGEEHPDTASAAANLAYGLAQQGRYGEAAELQRRALAIRRKILRADHPDIAENLGNLGYALGQQQDYAGADPLFREALASLIKAFGKDSLAVARATNNLAANLDSLGKAKEAAPLYARALAIRRKLLGPDHPLALLSLNNVAYSAFNQGRAAEAVNAYRQVVEAERRIYATGNPARTVALGNLAMAVSEQPGHDTEALGLAREAAGIAAARRAAIVSGAAAGGDGGTQALVRARSAETLRNDPLTTAFVALTQIDWRAAQRDAAATPALRAEAFVAAQELEVSAAALAMARTAARTASGGGPLGELVARQQALSERLARLDKSQSAALAAKSTEVARTLAAETLAAANELAAVDAEIARKFPRYRDLIAPTPLKLDDVQKRLRAGEGLLLIVPSNEDMVSFAVTRDNASWHLSPGRLIRTKGDVAALLCQIDPLTCSGATPAAPLTPFEREGYARFDRTIAHGLYRDLIAPVEGALGGVTSLYVTTVGSLATLPLGLLVTAPPAPGDDADPALLATTPWLAERYAITVLPAVANLGPADAAPRARGKGFVGYGAPALGELAEAKRGAGAGKPRPAGVADQALLRTLAPLPGTVIELTAMAKALDSPAAKLRLGARDTERAVKDDRDLARARVVAFSTHGLLPRELGAFAEPGLVFTPPDDPSVLDDGVLAASEAAELRLTADWVVLSACNTAGAESGAESLSGLARSFLYAGADSLLVSYWRVSDAATAVLTVEALKADRTLSRAAAVREAMRAVRTGRRDDGSSISGWEPAWAHPAAWAPFSVIANRDD